MNKIIRILIICLFNATPLYAQALPITPTEAALDSVVMVKSPHGGSGSGFFISADGYVITNAHVVKMIERRGVEPIVKTRGGKTYRVRVIKIDLKEDLALLKIIANEKVAYLKLDKGRTLPGEPLILLGYSTKSLCHRNIEYIGYSRFSKWEGLATEGIRPGDSGGPIVDKDMNVVGVGSAYSTRNFSTMFVPLIDIKRFLYEQ